MKQKSAHQLKLRLFGTLRGRLGMRGCFAGFSRKTPPHLPLATRNPKDPKLQDKTKKSLLLFSTLVVVEIIMSLAYFFSASDEPAQVWFLGLSRNRCLVAASLFFSAVYVAIIAFKLWKDKAWSNQFIFKTIRGLGSTRLVNFFIILAYAALGYGIVTLFNSFFSSNYQTQVFIARFAPLIFLGSAISLTFLGIFPPISAWHPYWKEIATGLIAIAFIVTVFAVKNNIGSFLIDDAWITFKYARNLAAGEGLTWEPAASIRTEGYSNLLEVLYIAAAMKMGLPPSIVAQTVGVLATTITILGLYFFIVKITQNRWMAVIPLAFYVIHPFTAVHTWSGLETQFFVALNALILISFWLALRESSPNDKKYPELWPVIVTVLSILVTITRTEGVSIGLLAMILGLFFSWRMNRKLWLWGTGLYCGFLISYNLWRWLYFGTLLTGPALVKLSTNLMPGKIASLEFISGGRDFLRASPLGLFTLILFPAGLYWVWAQTRANRSLDTNQQRPVLLLAILQLLALSAIYSRTNMIQNFASRFYVQSSAQQILIIGIALSGLYRGWKKFLLSPAKNRLPGFLFILCTCLLFWTALRWFGDLKNLTRSQERFITEYNIQQAAALKIAEVLQIHAIGLPNEWLVTVVDSGILPYYSPAKTLGGDGLTDGNLSGLVPPVGEKASYYATYIFKHNPAIFVIEIYPGDELDPHHEALVCHPKFNNYEFISGVKRTIGNTYNIYLRKDLPGFVDMASEFTLITDPLARWEISLENAKTTCPHQNQ